MKLQQRQSERLDYMGYPFLLLSDPLPLNTYKLTKVTYIFIATHAVWASQMKLIFCCMFEYIKCICQIYKSFVLQYPNCNKSHEDSVVNNIYHVSS